MNINKNSIIFFKSRSTNDIYARSIKFRKILKKTIPVIVAIFFIFIFFWESFFTLNKIEERNGIKIDPNKENPPKEDEFFYIVTDKCTECNGFYDEPQCAAVCPVDCCILDEENVEKEEDLINKKKWLHKD